MRIELPDDLFEARIQVADLPPGWNEVPDHPECVKHGDAWMKAAETSLLRAPSAIIPEEENILINPQHADAERIVVQQVRPFAFDMRLHRKVAALDSTAGDGARAS